VVEEAVELFVVTDRELEVTRVDAGLFVVAVVNRASGRGRIRAEGSQRERRREEKGDEPGSVSGEFEHFGSEVFEDGGEVDWKREMKDRRRRERVSEEEEKREEKNVLGVPAPIRRA
jgi:hypothetical protein